MSTYTLEFRRVQQLAKIVRAHRAICKETLKQANYSLNKYYEVQPTSYREDVRKLTKFQTLTKVMQDISRTFTPTLDELPLTVEQITLKAQQLLDAQLPLEYRVIQAHDPQLFFALYSEYTPVKTIQELRELTNKKEYAPVKRKRIRNMQEITLQEIEERLNEFTRKYKQTPTKESLLKRDFTLWRILCNQESKPEYQLDIVLDKMNSNEDK
jgi:hypothetical protein